MVAVEDKRRLASEYGSIARALSPSGKLPTAKELAVLALDRERLHEAIHTECELVGKIRHSCEDTQQQSEESEFYNYELRYRGRPASITYVGSDDTPRTLDFGKVHLADFHLKHTNYFPNTLVDRLVDMHAQGAGQEELYAQMERFYTSKNYSIPDFTQVKETQATVKAGGRRADGSEIRHEDPNFRDQNLFLIWMNAHECTRGMGLAGRIIKNVLGTSVSSGCRYALVYTRMAEFMEKTGKTEVATPEEAREYFEEVKNGSWSDWSIKFHVNAGARMLFALPEIAVDDESRGAGAFGIYNIEELKGRITKKDRLKIKHIW
ncbi:MAG: hypothetical protein KKD39_08680 [Candidatus Altiarchaeota archaeon]|nr:hypothetical protein [Candidatus Altiarchaeota archaeon]